jgi:uncharacterized protein YndB with AHSA1/START domain
MLKIERTVTINAPLEKVFEYACDPVNVPEFWPSLIKVEDVKRLPSGGYTFKYTFKMAGMHLNGTAENLEYVPNKRIVLKVKAGIDATITWKFETLDGKTRMIHDAEYVIPAALLGKLAEPFIAKVNEHDADSMLANLKARMEVGVPVSLSR